MRDGRADDVGCARQDPVDLRILGQGHGGDDIVFQVGKDRQTGPRVIERENRRLLRIVDLHQGRRILGDIAAIGDHQSDEIADIGDPINRHHIDRPWRRRGNEMAAHQLDVQRFQIAPAVDCPYAGQGRCGGGIDRADRPARDRAAHESDVQQAGEDDIVDKRATPREQARVFLARQALADEAGSREHMGHHIMSRGPTAGAPCRRHRR